MLRKCLTQITATVVLFTMNAASGVTVTSPTIMASFSEMTSQTSQRLSLDAPLSSFKVPNGSGGYYTKWIGTNINEGGATRIAHTLYRGDQDFPYGALEWEKPTCPYQNGYCASVNGSWAAFTASNVGYVKNDDLWFTSVYQPDVNQPGLLAFVHEEHINGSTSSNYVGYTGIGLAWSNDYGNSWRYLGRIISPDSNFSKLGHNVQGTPYLINGEYIYIYFSDRTGVPSDSLGSYITSARAKLSDVITNAKAGWSNPGFWNKYNNGMFNSPGMGGASTSIGIEGINHTQAAHSSFNGKYYLILSSINWDGADTYVKLYESTDGYTNWVKAVDVALEPASSQPTASGYQYCSLSDSSGATNSQVGQKMFIYCIKNPSGGSLRALYRWEVNLGSGDYYRQSINFSSSQGPYWYYLFGTNLASMTWQGDYWQGSDYWSRIYSDILHPGAASSGNQGTPILTWRAPRSGWIRIDGTLRKKDISCGDGVYASAVHNGTNIFQSYIGYNDNVGHSIDRSQATRWVNAGDGLFFMISGGSNNYCDSTYWDPSITYQ
jgi:hypothetical protein